MTSASELFNSRRSRFGRQSPDLGLDPSSLDRSFHDRGRGNRRYGDTARRDRREPDVCDPSRRSLIPRHHPHRPSPNSERESVQADEASQSSLGSSVNLENLGSVRNRARFCGNERLPGAVLLARERLLERLRGVSLSGSRRSNGAGLRNNRYEWTVGENSRLVDSGDFWGAEISPDSLVRDLFLASLSSQTDQMPAARAMSRRRPPGLTEEAFSHLQLEVFTESNHCENGEINLRELQECSICLEGFAEGEQLICLPCAHRFHLVCLDPWIRACGDCPYCRRAVPVSCN